VARVRLDRTTVAAPVAANGTRAACAGISCGSRLVLKTTTRRAAGEAATIPSTTKKRFTR
jgi:hypothetical protein